MTSINDVFILTLCWFSFKLRDMKSMLDISFALLGSCSCRFLISDMSCFGLSPTIATCCYCTHLPPFLPNILLSLDREMAIPGTARSDHRIQSEHQSLSTTSSKPLTAKSLLHYHLSSRQMPKKLVPNTKIVRMDVHPSHIWYIYIYISEIRSISALGMFHCDLRQVAFHGVKLVQQLGLCRLLVLRMSWIISGYTNFVKERLMTYSTIDGWSMLIMCFHERWIPSLLDQPGQYRSFCPLSSEQKPPWSARCLNYENHWPDRKQQTVSEWTDAS